MSKNSPMVSLAMNRKKTGIRYKTPDPIVTKTPTMPLSTEKKNITREPSKAKAELTMKVIEL